MSLAGLLIIFAVLTLTIVVGLIIFLRRRLAVGRGGASTGAVAGRMPSPTSGEEK
jgi:hypothetical protein